MPQYKKWSHFYLWLRHPHWTVLYVLVKGLRGTNIQLMQLVLMLYFVAFLLSFTSPFLELHVDTFSIHVLMIPLRKSCSLSTFAEKNPIAVVNSKTYLSNINNPPAIKVVKCCLLVMAVTALLSELHRPFIHFVIYILIVNFSKYRIAKPSSVLMPLIFWAVHFAP